MFENVKADWARYSRAQTRLRFPHKCRRFLLSYGFHALPVYRFGKWSESQIVPLRYPLLVIYYLVEIPIRASYGIHIKRTAIIGPGLYIGHFGGILLGDCMIGSNTAISPRVTIEKDYKGTPIIGKSVWIGPHAKIVGPVHIGDGATVGAGTMVANDISPRCLVMGDPARVVSADYDNSLILSVGVRLVNRIEEQPPEAILSI
jgi:serine O-acetyltransferase